MEALRSGDDEKLLGIMRIVIKDNLHRVLSLRSVEGKVRGHNKRKCRLVMGSD